MANSVQRVAIYARVSTSNGHQDPEMQLRELREFVERRGWQITGEYVDKGISGSKGSRPALDRLMADASRRKFDAVLVWKPDRFGRSLRHLVNALAELEALGLTFVSLRDNLDLSTPSGRLMFQIIGAMAEFERALIQERVKAGLRNAKAKGVRLGRPQIFVSESRIDALRGAGASWRAVAKELGVALGTCVAIWLAGLSGSSIALAQTVAVAVVVNEKNPVNNFKYPRPSQTFCRRETFLGWGSARQVIRSCDWRTRAGGPVEIAGHVRE